MARGAAAAQTPVGRGATLARNKAAERHDAAGLLPPSAQLDTTAPYVLLPPSGPGRLLSSAREQGLPIAPSVHAGDYLCNALFFHSLLAARRRAQPRLVAFLHLPVRVGGAGLAEDEALNVDVLQLEAALAGATCVLQAMVEQFSSAMAHGGTSLAAAE
jgi:pyroglutamyl-peptidase